MASNVAFEWEVTGFESTHMTINLDFAEPIQISQQVEPNFIIIYIWDRHLFVYETNGDQIFQNARFEKQLPPQINVNEQEAV